MTVRFKKLSEKVGNSVPSPFYATKGSAGVDVAACVDETIIIEPSKWVKVPTGLALEIDNTNIVGLVFPRSGLAYRNGITLQNAVGVIDSDYRGPLEILIRNEGPTPIEVKNGDRIAQLVFVPIYQVNIEFVEQLKETDRGSGGFGSTGV
ncbi:deoxyuridine 5'-triphosphate nucleotidohydrolase [Desulfuribacillus alkaliarsenatis]|uniref:Deoxyuridine 5'-triphosphate nucleotidohydrolase n=1 Tax=Desulfuribacillus alkaliarsenatis TaxID=766136 RepID=A0A1E5G6I3_9FIRM|nr:deoxyuridine 5'-triphosphate nucleotidohydrolase [Desulfuribacillus alkaliarsenatis]